MKFKMVAVIVKEKLFKIKLFLTQKLDVEIYCYRVSFVTVIKHFEASR